MGGAAGHRVLDVFDRRDGRAGVHERIILHHALVHAVEGDEVAVRRDVLALVDAPFAAMHRLAKDNVLACVGAEQHRFETVQGTFHKHPFVILDNKHLMFDVLFNDIIPIHLVESGGGDFAVHHADRLVVAREVKGIGIKPLIAIHTRNLMRFLRRGGEKDRLLAVFRGHQLDILVIVDVGILVCAGPPRNTVNIVNDVALLEIDVLAENRCQQCHAKDAKQKKLFFLYSIIYTKQKNLQYDLSI